jgi:hypothetical protein
VGGPPNGLVLLGRESGSMAREGKEKNLAQLGGEGEKGNFSCPARSA